MLKGELVSIRTVRETDLDSVYQLSTDHCDAGEYMPAGLVSESSFKAEFWKTGFWQDTCGKLLVEDQEGELVGEIGCFKLAHYIDGREVYYRIYSGHRRKGYASDALVCFINFFFESTSFSRLQGVTIEGNSISATMLEKIGFQSEGQLREARWFKGRLVNLNIFSFVRSDWVHNQALHRTSR